MLQFTNARHAIQYAASCAPAIVGWKSFGSVWIVYNPKDGAPNGIEPEIFVARQGVLPIALSDAGASVLRSALTATTQRNF